ncbi:MAG: winged helix-turn-helix domain-containing protein [Nitrososphaerales archaeon]
MSFEIDEARLPDQQRLKTRFKNRNRLGIVANILTIAKTGALKTHLMYKANLSYTMLRDYLKFLRDNDLLSESHYPEDKVTLYRTTEKGNRFLESYLALRDLAAPIIDKRPFAQSNPSIETIQNRVQLSESNWQGF